MRDRIYIFGAGTNGQQCLKTCRGHGIKVEAFLDNFTDTLLVGSTPVLRPQAADRTVPVVVTSPTAVVDIMLQLDWLGFQSVLNLSQFYTELSLEPDWAGDLRRNHPEYEWARNKLADNASRTVFDAMVKFRRTLDTLYPAAVRRDMKDQWFDPEFFSQGPHVYIDGGAYDGDSAAEFIKRCPGYKSAHLFEPSSTLAEKAKERFRHQIGVHVEHCGLSDQRGAGKLQNAGLPSGSIGPSGEWTTLCALDDYDIKPTFIKLDVEGFEKAALLGARQHIKKLRPMLAVAVYHRPEDIWDIPRLLSGMQNYRFHLRHYTQFYHETVLYCI